MNNNIFNIDIYKAILWQVPGFLRALIRMKWLGVLVSPVVLLYSKLTSFRNDKLYQMSHNGQVVYLRKVLNDKFDPIQREITVQNVGVMEPVWHYDTVEEKPVYYYDTADEKPVYFRDQADFDSYLADFVVNIPNRLKPATISEQESFEMAVNLLVNYYKLYSKKYLLKYV